MTSPNDILSMSNTQLEDHIIDCNRKYGFIPAEDQTNIFLRILKLIEQPLDQSSVVRTMDQAS